MGRKITQKEIDRLEEYNKTHKYVSVEAYQDLLDWIPEMSDESLKNYWTTLQYKIKFGSYESLSVGSVYCPKCGMHVGKKDIKSWDLLTKIEKCDECPRCNKK